MCRRGSQLRRHCGIEAAKGCPARTEVSPQPAVAAPLRYLLDLGLKQGWAGDIRSVKLRHHSDWIVS